MLLPVYCRVAISEYVIISIIFRLWFFELRSAIVGRKANETVAKLIKMAWRSSAIEL